MECKCSLRQEFLSVTYLGNIIERTKTEVFGVKGLAFVQELYEQLEIQLIVAKIFKQLFELT